MRHLLLLPALALVGCGGPDRETFVEEANTACRDRAAGQESLAELPVEEMLPAATRLYEQELQRLRALEPPEDDRASHDEWVEANAAVVAAWRRYAANARSEAAREQLTDRYEYAAALAARLGLRDCDS